MRLRAPALSRTYSDSAIGEKIGVGASWVNMIASLMERGEERLVAAVETGLIPITLAMEISKAETEEAQNLLLDAYETGKLRGKKLAAVRRMLDMRMRAQGKELPSGRLGRKSSGRRMTANDLMQVYQREAEKQRLLVKKSDFTQTRLLFVVEALKELLTDEGFLNLLRAEGVFTMPRARCLCRFPERAMTDRPKDPNENGGRIHLAFDRSFVTIPVSSIVPLKALPEGARESRAFSQVLSSIKAIGLVEAPVVMADTTNVGSYFLLDGHLRIEALKELGITEAECLLATDDDTYTYNKRVNRIPPIQEHRMIARAMERGVSSTDIAEALNLQVESVLRRYRLLEGISAEAAEMLKDKPCSMKVFDILRQMTAVRQIVIQAKQDDEMWRLATIPGVGAIIAMAVKAFVPDPAGFKSARHFAAWIGLIPKAHSSGGKERLGRISKMGNPVLRSLLTTGAASVLRHVQYHDRVWPWLKNMLTRRPFKVVAVALANKTAWMIWALLTRGGVYRDPIGIEAGSAAA